MTRGEGFPAAETAHELRRAVDAGCPIHLFEDGGTLITKGRSTAAAEFLRSEADVWVSFDDDVFASAPTLRALLAATRETRGLVACPALFRAADTVNYRIGEFRQENVRTLQSQTGGGEQVKLYPVACIAFSCVCMHREIVQKVAGSCEWVADHGRRIPFLFSERPHRGTWLGEDFGFCLDVTTQTEARCWALLEHPITHAGVACMLDSEGQVMRAGDHPTADATDL